MSNQFFNAIAREKFEQNKLNGMIAELMATSDFRENGFLIKRTGFGSDFIAYKNIPNQVKPYQMYVEVKYNKAELSPLQQKQKFLLRRQKIDYFLLVGDVIHVIQHKPNH